MNNAFQAKKTLFLQPAHPQLCTLGLFHMVILDVVQLRVCLALRVTQTVAKTKNRTTNLPQR
jgi:hypothetical protein